MNPVANLLEQAADLLCHDLDRIIGRVTRHDARLHLEREDGLNWVVADLANDEVMLRTPDLAFAFRFATAFQDKHPESALDESFGLCASEPVEGFSVRVPDNVLPFERKASA